ncbi:retrovirus-related pol polyprotein from transposon TNT 1-94 [Tanacetum coccineum]
MILQCPPSYEQYTTKRILVSTHLLPKDFALLFECIGTFDVLGFWKAKENQFPVLSRMAMDILSVQAYSVASESAFLTSGRLLTIRRTRLTSESLEMCMCLKDHLDAQERKQDTSPLELPLDVEEDVFNVEVQQNEATHLTDQDIALDASSDGSSGEPQHDYMMSSGAEDDQTGDGHDGSMSHAMEHEDTVNEHEETSSDDKETEQDDNQITSTGTIQKVGGNRTSKAKKKLKMIEDDKGKKMNKALPSIKARSSPRDLVKIINGLTPLQKEDVIEMGFGSFLNDNFQINTTPTKLGLWVVENFDPDKCIIRMNDGRSILITSKMINEMIGIPMGTMVVTEVPTATTEFPLIVDWRQTYKYPDERFTIKSVVERLMFEHENGRVFKLNFLVIFFSIIGDCPKMGTVNQRFLPCIEREEDIKNMDWCTYLLGTMKKTRREYKKSQGFGGPLLLMVLLYLNATISEKVIIEEQTPLMKSWDTLKLKLREKEELNLGGFGRLPIKEAYQYVEQPRKQRLTKGAIRLMKNSPAKELGYNQEDITHHVYTPKVNLEDGVFEIAEGSNKIEAIKQFQKKKAEDMEIDIKNTLTFTECVQNKVDEMLEIAAISYPENEEFKKLVEIRNEKLMNAFKSGKVAAMLEFENVIEYIILNGIDNNIYSTIDACPNAIEMWKVIKRLKQGDSINVQDLKINLPNLKNVSYHKLYDILKQHHNEVNEIRAEILARNVNPLAIVANTQQPVYYPRPKSTYYTQSSSTISQAAARNKEKEIANAPSPTYDLEPEAVNDEDSAQKDRPLTHGFMWSHAGRKYKWKEIYGENLDKIKEKGDPCNFMGYYTQSKGYRVYNKRTRFIVETIHVNFDELPQMMFEHNSSNLDPQRQTMASDHNNSGLAPQFVSKSSAITTVDASDKRQPQNTTPSTSTTIAADLTQLDIQTTPEPTTQEQNDNANENINQVENVMVDEDEFINIFGTLVYEQGESSSRHVDPREEPKNIKEAMANHAWIEAMHEELHRFERLDVWELVDRSYCKNVINMKWFWKAKCDEENIVIHKKHVMWLKDIVRKKE